MLDPGHCPCGRHHTDQCALCENIRTHRDEPRTPKEVTQARVGHLAWDLRETIADLSALRLDPIGAPYVAAEIAVLMECKTALDVLASNILEAADRKLRIVKNG